MKSHYPRKDYNNIWKINDTFAAASGGTIESDNAQTWVNVAGSEDYTHFSLWDNSTAGNCLFTGTITANAVTAGDTFTIASGDIDLTLE